MSKSEEQKAFGEAIGWHGGSTEEWFEFLNRCSSLKCTGGFPIPPGTFNENTQRRTTTTGDIIMKELGPDDKDDWRCMKFEEKRTWGRTVLVAWKWSPPSVQTEFYDPLAPTPGEIWGRPPVPNDH